MDIIYNIKDIVGFEAKDPTELKEKLVEYFTIDGFKAEVIVDGDWVIVRVDEQEIKEAEKRFEGITSLCDKGKFNDAKTAIKEFLKSYPRYSDAYRVLAQIYMQDGLIEDAINTNIEALRCNPRNGWALLLMGNLFGKYKNDTTTAENYYNKILEYCPDNAIACNNIAAVMLERNEYDKAIPIFKHVLDVNEKYGNAYYGLALAYYNQKDFKNAFEYALAGSLNADRQIENPNVLDELHKLMVVAAKNLVSSTNYINVMLGIKDSIELESKSKVKIEEDNNLEVSAKLQYGKVYNRNYNLVKYNPKMPYMEHLVIHELMHLDMALEASKRGSNMIVYSNNENKLAFRNKYASWISNIVNKFGHSRAMSVVDKMHEGLMVQIMNCPLDLFVEKRMYDKYPIVKAAQLLSLMHQETLNQESIAKGQQGIFPKSIVTASKIMNIVSSIHLEKLFGLRFYQNYKPTKAEFETAKDLYEEYLAYHDYRPGEEYELVEYFAETLGMQDFFKLKNESEFVKDTNQEKESENYIREALLGDTDSSDGNSFDGLTDEQKKKQDTFYEQNKDGADPMQTMMMSMYMVGALDYFDGMTKDQIKRIAFDIAMLGMKGISPEIKSGYKVDSIPGKDFGGYEMLAYYYVSWALAIPEQLGALGLPFTKAWETAKELWRRKKS